VPRHEKEIQNIKVKRYKNLALSFLHLPPDSKGRGSICASFPKLAPFYVTFNWHTVMELKRARRQVSHTMSLQYMNL